MHDRFIQAPYCGYVLFPVFTVQGFKHHIRDEEINHQTPVLLLPDLLQIRIHSYTNSSNRFIRIIYPDNSSGYLQQISTAGMYFDGISRSMWLVIFSYCRHDFLIAAIFDSDVICLDALFVSNMLNIGDMVVYVQPFLQFLRAYWTVKLENHLFIHG